MRVEPLEDDTHGGGATAGSVTVINATSASSSSSRKPLRMVLQRVEVHSIDGINVHDQTFQARLYIVIVLPGAARDPDLRKDSAEFPIDEHGNPTFKPAAKWYLEKFDFINCDGTDRHTLDQTAVAVGDDMELRMRYAGSFHQHMDLSSFPFDDQILQASLALYCRSDGPLAVQLEVADKVHLDIVQSGFCLEHLWELDRSITVYQSACLLGGRHFPMLNVGVHVVRRPKWVGALQPLPSPPATRT